jgi:hypothetical protein
MMIPDFWAMGALAAILATARILYSLWMIRMSFYLG